MTSPLTPIYLPIVTVQHDFEVVMSDIRDGTIPAEDFWISCYRNDLGVNDSVHGKVGVSRATGAEGGLDLTSKDGVKCERGEKGTYTVSCPSLDIKPTRIRLPRQTIRVRDADSTGTQDAYHSQHISAFDVSPDMTHIAAGYNDGSIYRRPVTRAAVESTSIKPTIYKPHVSEITSVRFFPSSKVILAAGADFSLTILDASQSADTPNTPSTEPARILKAHHRAITDTAIISRGRNVLSCAKDGTLRLWDVGSAKQIKVMGATRYTPITGMSMGPKSATWGLWPPDGEEIGTATEQGEGDEKENVVPILDSREVETTDKLVFCALADGEFEVFDLASKTSVFKSEIAHAATEANSPWRSMLTSITYDTVHNLLATGSRTGLITVYDTRDLSKPLTSFKRNDSSIEDLAFVTLPPGSQRVAAANADEGDSDRSSVGLVIATEDGLPYIAGVRPEGPDVIAELIGIDCYPVRVVKVDSDGGIWTALDDGVVRLY